MKYKSKNPKIKNRIIIEHGISRKGTLFYVVFKHLNGVNISYSYSVFKDFPQGFSKKDLEIFLAEHETDRQFYNRNYDNLIIELEKTLEKQLLQGMH